MDIAINPINYATLCFMHKGISGDLAKVLLLRYILVLTRASWNKACLWSHSHLLWLPEVLHGSASYGVGDVCEGVRSG